MLVAELPNGLPKNDLSALVLRFHANDSRLLSVDEQSGETASSSSVRPMLGLAGLGVLVLVAADFLTRFNLFPSR